MVNYQLGKIYKIIDNTTGKVYIGSTCRKTLAERLSHHVYEYKRYLETGDKYISSIEVLQNNNYEILLLEEYPCSSKDALHARERFYTHSMECVNRYKNQGLTNELGPKEYNRQRRENNHDTISAREKLYYVLNPEKKKEKSKTYREKHKEAIKERKSRTYTCPCGSCSTIDHKARHERTKKHQNYLKTLETVEIP